jgi:hypothetical protein
MACDNWPTLPARARAAGWAAGGWAGCVQRGLRELKAGGRCPSGPHVANSQHHSPRRFRSIAQPLHAPVVIGRLKRRISPLVI